MPLPPEDQLDPTPNLQLPYIAAAQAQKHVTHNEAIRRLDALVQLAVADRDLTAPPSSPSDGTRYLVATGASGAWDGQAGRIAAWQDGAWSFLAPHEGWICWVADEDVALVFDGTGWVALAPSGGGASFNPVTGGLLGVNATATTTNRLAVAAPAVLFNHDGAGHQLKVNKAAATNTAALLFQTGFSGRAELGTAGDDDFHVKVSADGTSWHEAIVIARASGAVSFPNSTIGGSNIAYTKRAAVKQTSATTLPVATMVELNWQNEVEDVGDWFVSANPSRLTVPTGIAVVACNAIVKLNGAGGTNGVIKLTQYSAAGALKAEFLDGLNFNLNWSGSLSSPPIACATGDYFTLSVYQNSGSTRTTDTGITIFTIAALA